MSLSYLRARNLLSLGESQILMDGFGPLNTIVGPNNSGKTNVFRALSFTGEAIRNLTVDTSPNYVGVREKGFDNSWRYIHMS